ncbi:TIGR03749 family integrating conjugative element protein [Haliea sp.]|jgi:integrating conjugative element protein (TIGR03749 family)|uniref:TIGR03749 family integrating conjugative element protein n=1 Tax=Haliea sp. TaxID=1932666 RepID=UPI000C5CCAFC|nr:TIGR03749 family integrating conjugative element protein [Haliea sp.]MAD65465.1 TIGR03749 family integrating conjugative element protein [Haliea sp.]MAY91476.1 TIGR03749 family integrating conjugative element protein [Haliea sp.]MBP68396.1 TIGR03749 family integrating conjugative element protein [Haliea sp.]|tara:strand:- start:6767 stop:7612 length:846 start_codon:yes stop_codon:yes gene_type:complete
MNSRDFCASLSLIALLGLCFPLLSFAQADDAAPNNPERVVWNKAPIAIPLVVSEERLVHFPDSVSIGLPQSLTPLLRSQSINGTLYLLARQAFEPTRVMVRSETDGPIYVLDISAAPGGADRRSLPDVQVLLQSPQKSRQNSPQKPLQDAGADQSISNNRSQPLGYAALTRYAAQQLYAPTRLIPRQPGVVAIPVNPEPVDLVLGGKIEAVPVATWKAGLRYVTAVKLINRTQSSVVLDPRELRGSWLAATFQHNRLLPAGSEADTTAVYLVSNRRFDAAF